MFQFFVKKVQKTQKIDKVEKGLDVEKITFFFFEKKNQKGLTTGSKGFKRFQRL